MTKVTRKKTIKQIFKRGTKVSNDDFAMYILPAAPLQFVKQTSEIKVDDGLRCAGREIAQKELKSRMHEDREYIGIEPMDEYLYHTLELKLSGKISAKDSVRCEDDGNTLLYAVYNNKQEIVGVLRVLPKILRQCCTPQ